MNLLRFPLLVFIASRLAFGGWQSIPSGTTGQLNKVFFVNRQQGFIVGESGILLKTLDSGLTWNQIQTGFSTSYKNVFFLTPSLGFICGSQGAIFKTTDVGATWKRTATPDSTTLLWDITMVSSSKGFAVGDASTTWQSTNGGETWSRVVLPTAFPARSQIFDVQFPTKDTGYVSYQSGILKTITGGDTWFVVYDGHQFFPTVPNGAYFVSSSVGFLVSYSYGLVAKTEDGGVTLLNQGATRSNDVFFTGKDTGYVVGSYIHKTINGGNIWEQQTPAGPLLRGVFFLDRRTGLAVGSGGTILRTTDGGGTTAIKPPGKSKSSYPKNKSSVETLFDVLGRVWSTPMKFLMKTEVASLKK
jgi:photosystem II stability/assembly factor-like uncharacterized protein